jgi:mycothiol S-conjugate amidase
MSAQRADRCVLTVHAHPDDESEFGAGTVARYHSEGVRTVLVCCTNGGLGRNQNPDFGPVGESIENVVAVRRAELEKAAAIVGYDEVVMLGYHDSGSIDLPDRPSSGFAQVPLEDSVGRLVQVIRRQRPQIVITYSDDHRIYPHPDHIRTHEVAVSAFAEAGNADAYPEAGPLWQPLKLYYTVTSQERRRTINQKYAALGMDPPFNSKPGAGIQGRGEVELAPSEERVTTRVDITQFSYVWIEAMRQHRCQITPPLSRILDIPRAAAPDVYGYEEFILARDHTECSSELTAAEVDIFARIS